MTGTGSGPDLLSGGPDRSPRSLPRGPVRALVAVALLLLAGVVAGRALSRPPPTTVPTAVAASAGPPHVVLRVGQVCPVVTDGDRLTVSFTLLNTGDGPGTLVTIEPDLPLPGVTPDGTTLAGGSCAAPVADAPGVLLFGGPSALVTFRFRLPPGCPAAYPVQARVVVREDRDESVLLPVLVDLGNIPFASCPPTY